MYLLKFKITLLLIIIYYTITAQYIPKFIGQVDSIAYERYSTILLRSWSQSQPEDSTFRWHNIFICYLHLKTHEDTVSKYLQKAFEYDNLSECDDVEDDKVKYSTFFKNYPTIWKSLCHQCDSVHKFFNKPLIQQLLEIGENDQKYRKTMNLSDITTYPELWKQQFRLDSTNIVQIEAIFQQYGYPSRLLVGRKAVKVPFLVVQHAPLHIQEKYFSMIEMAAQNRHLDKSDVAYLLDRILMKKGLPQIYGTQFIWNEKTQKMELYPVKEIQNIDILRKKVGLNKLIKYLQSNHIEMPSK